MFFTHRVFGRVVRIAATLAAFLLAGFVASELMFADDTEEDFGGETANGEVAILRGMTTEAPDDGLLDAHQHLPDDRRLTHISGRQYDRIFYSPPLGEVDPDHKDLVFSKVILRRLLVVQCEVDQNHRDGYHQIPRNERDISDHYPLVTEFVFK